MFFANVGKLFFFGFCLLTLALPLNTYAKYYPSSSLNFGTGIITVPSARFQPSGSIGFNYSKFDPYRQYRLSFSPFSNIEASFFYNDINSWPWANGQTYKDKGFAIKAGFLNDNSYLPPIAVGLEDFAGTGFNRSEYIVTSFGNELYDLTLGIGWGRLGSEKNIKNPLIIFDKSFKERRGGFTGRGGIPEVDKFFKGDASAFFGLEISLPYQTILMIDYNPVDYFSQLGYGRPPKRRDKTIYLAEKVESNYNIGLSRNIGKNVNANISLVQGNKLAVNFTINKDFSESKKIYFASTKFNKSRLYLDILNDLRSKGVLVQKIDYKDNVLLLEYIQTISSNEAEVTEEINRYFLNSNIEFDTLELIPVEARFKLATSTFDSRNVKTITNTNIRKLDESEFKPRVIYPSYGYGFSPGYQTHIGSPAGFVFGELNITASGFVVFNNNIEFDTEYTYPIADNYERLRYNPAPTKLEPVRIRIQEYLKKGTKGFDTMTLSFFKQFENNNHFLFMVGEFERMFGGMHFEYLKSFNSFPISIGFETSRVKQRNFEKKLFRYRDYETDIAHINFYTYEPVSRLQLHLSYGKYLAKDKGFTFDLSRRFQNGLVMGAFFSLTNITEDEFGEGSFDKGFYFNYPVSLFSSKPRKGRRTFLYRPLTRDGASKLNVSKRLYDLTKYSTKFDY